MLSTFGSSPGDGEAQANTLSACQALSLTSYFLTHLAMLIDGDGAASQCDVAAIVPRHASTGPDYTEHIDSGQEEDAVTIDHSIPEVDGADIQVSCFQLMVGEQLVGQVQLGLEGLQRVRLVLSELMMISQSATNQMKNASIIIYHHHHSS